MMTETDLPKTRALNTTNLEEAKAASSDLEVYGEDLWTVICKASSKSEGWMKSTKAMPTPTGCLVQVTTKEGNQIAEALTFVPGVAIIFNEDGHPYLCTNTLSNIAKSWQEILND